MDVVALPEFVRSIRTAIDMEPETKRVDGLLNRLSVDHDCPVMWENNLQIPGTDVDVWATRKIRLSGAGYRVTWRYEERNGHSVIVCFTFTQISSP